MELADYIAELRDELASITRFAGQEMADAAQMLTDALVPAVRLTLLDVLSAAAAEITQQLDDTVIEVRLASGSPDFVVTVHPGSQHAGGQPGGGAADDTDDASMARITLRLPESLKARVEAAAATASLSVNSWLIQAAQRAADELQSGRSRKHGPGAGQRFTGYARS